VLFGVALAVAATALVAVAVLPLRALDSVRPEPPPSVGAEPPSPYGWPRLATGWTELAPPPIVRARATAVWTGTELFYWGGDTNYGGTEHEDGAMYEPGVDRWRPIAAAPISPRSGAGAVWTGSEVLVWGDGQDGAAYDPAADRWRVIAAAPIPPEPPVAAVWTGGEMVVWGDRSRLEGAD
jgi:hypothetical protein